MAGINPTVVKQIIVKEQFRPYVGQVDEHSPVKYVDWLYMSILQLCLPQTLTLVQPLNKNIDSRLWSNNNPDKYIFEQQ